MIDINFLTGAFVWSLNLWPVLATIGFFGLLILLVGVWIVYDAIHWRKQVNGVRRRLKEKDLTVYGLRNGR